jgi:tetratricopeptide (TPR) repeat protein
VESIHTMRRGDFVPALSRGVEAMSHIKKVKELAPLFADPVLGDGLYLYWKSVISMNSKLIPDGEDQRIEGMGLMRKAEVESTFVKPAATLALAFSWIEEREFKRALESCMRNRRDYPKNIINNMVMGRVHMYMRKYDNSLQVFQEVLAEAPDNMRVHYYMATTYLRMRDLDSAEIAIDKYLAYDLEPEFKAAGLHRKADIYYRRKDYKTAEKLYKEAVKVYDYEGVSPRDQLCSRGMVSTMPTLRASSSPSTSLLASRIACQRVLSP